MSVLIVGSIGLDDIKTPAEEQRELLGGSASYAAIAASFFCPPRLVGIVGEDFPGRHLDLFRERKVDIAGLRIVPGKTFRWAGEYHWDMNSRETRSIELNVFENFRPEIPPAYRQTPVVLLANIAPDLQHLVLDQVSLPRFVIADTMDLWIEIARPRLLELLARIHMLILNDGEARQLTDQTSLIRAGRQLQGMGPQYVAVKKGEHGCLLFGPGGEFFTCPAYPLEDLHDPTGAGDTFAGGLAGFIAAAQEREIDFELLKQAVVRASVLASFNVEEFSLERLKRLDEAEVTQRLEEFRRLAKFD